MESKRPCLRRESAQISGGMWGHSEHAPSARRKFSSNSTLWCSMQNMATCLCNERFLVRSVIHASLRVIFVIPPHRMTRLTILACPAHPTASSWCSAKQEISHPRPAVCVQSMHAPRRRAASKTRTRSSSVSHVAIPRLPPVCLGSPDETLSPQLI